ncbi:hypothetical protein SAMN03097719_1259 [Pantoea ananatis]|nr:hypothetical protein SAMN03097719_1259 [Pantoea ananatis]
MRSPDRGSTKRPAVLHGRRPPEGRAQRVNPPLTAIFKEEPELTFRLFFTYSPPRGMRSPDRGSTKRPAVLHGRRPPEGRAQRVNPPFTATFKEESRLTSGLFFAYSPLRGMRSPDRGSTKRPAVLHGRRPPAGRAQRVNPPFTATYSRTLKGQSPV